MNATFSDATFFSFYYMQNTESQVAPPYVVVECMHGKKKDSPLISDCTVNTIGKNGCGKET